MAQQAVPGTPAPPPPPFVAPLVEVMTPRLVGHEMGDRVALKGFTEGEFQALLDSGAIRLANKATKAVDKEASDG